MADRRGGGGGRKGGSQPTYVPKVQAPSSGVTQAPAPKASETPKKQTTNSKIEEASRRTGNKVTISRPQASPSVPPPSSSSPLTPSSRTGDASSRQKQSERFFSSLNEEVDHKNASERSQGKPTDKSVVFYISELNEVKSTKAIDVRWSNVVEILPFLPIDNDPFSSGLGVDPASHRRSTIEIYSFISEDLSRLLRLKYHVFWSHVLYQSSVRAFLDSFLRFYRDVPSSSNATAEDNTDEETFQKEQETLRALRQAIFQKTFRLILRMSQSKETSADFVSDDFFSKSVTPLFDILKHIDIYRIYGEYQFDALSKLSTRVLSATQPHEIATQMRAITDQTTLVLSQLINSIVELYQRDQQLLDQLNRSSSVGSVPLEQIGTSEADFTEIIHYLHDIGVSTTKFLAFTRTFTSEAFYKNHLDVYLRNKNPLSFLGLSVYIVELAVPMLRKITNAHPTIQRRKALTKKLADTTESFLYVINAIQKGCFNDRIATARTMNAEEAAETDKKIERFLFFIKDIRKISEKISQNFRLDLPLCKIASGYCLGKLDLVYHLEKDVQLYKMKTSRLEEKRFEDVVSMLRGISKSLPKMSKELEYVTKIEEDDDDDVFGQDGSDDSDDVLIKYTIRDDPTSSSSSSSFSDEFDPISSISDERLDNIKKLKTVLGDDFGDGFLNACLDYFRDSIDATVSSVLDNSLPLELSAIDVAMPLIDRFEELPSKTDGLRSAVDHMSAEERAFIINNARANNYGLIEDDSEDESEENNDSETTLYNDEYDDSMDHYSRFGVGSAETLDETHNLTTSQDSTSNNDQDGDPDDSPFRRPSNSRPSSYSSSSSSFGGPPRSADSRRGRPSVPYKGNRPQAASKDAPKKTQETNRSKTKGQMIKLSMEKN